MTVAGDLTQRIYIQERDPALGALREQSKAWVMFTPAGIWSTTPFQPRAREFNEGGQQQNEGAMVFRCRYRVDITDKMRLLWLSTPYDIVGINPVREGGGREWIDIVARTGVRDGRLA